MAIYIIISILSLLLLVTLHELGHFWVAKKFGVKVEEFGIGLPPRLFAKKFGETIYSLNLLPIGAFVRLYGEEEKVKNKRSFSEKTIGQRALILLGGVVAFWIVAFVLLSFIAYLGLPTPIADDLYSPAAQIIILATEEGLPAEKGGIKSGDILLRLGSGNEELTIRRVAEVRNFLSRHQGQEIIALIKRGQLEKEVFLTSLEEGGKMGVFLERMEIQRSSWYQAPFRGALMTGQITVNLIYLLGHSAQRAILGEPLPPGIQVTGPVGIVRDFFAGALKRGVVDYLQVMVMISISLAVFNLLPIPILDGGRLLFLAIEKIKGTPINPQLEQKLILISFMLLIGLFSLVTFYDIRG